MWKLRRLGVIALTMAGLGASASQVWGQSNHRTTNRYELDPELNGMWFVSEPDNPVQVSFSKLEADDLEIQLDELKRIIKFSSLVPVGQRDRLVTWVLDKLDAMQAASDSQKAPSTRLLTQALVTAIGKLGGKEHGDLLWRIAQTSPDLAMQVESVLMQWNHPAPLNVWRERIKNLDGDWQAISLAIQGIETYADEGSIDSLLALLSKPNLPLPIKIASSRVLGRLKKSGLEPMAREFFESTFPAKELFAAQLIAEHDSQDAMSLQQELVRSSQPVAVSIAYSSLSQFHESLASELAPALFSHSEFLVRKLAIENLSNNPDEANLRQLASALNDTHVDLRDLAREALFQHSFAPEWRLIVDRIVDQQIADGSELAVEQALILAVQLDRKDLCQRMLVLLDHPKEILRIRAAWGLQEIAAGEETILQVLGIVTRFTEQLRNGPGIDETERVQLAYLLHVFGTNYYGPAESLLREYVPKGGQKMTPHARGPAIWSLGKILQGSGDRQLSAQLQERFFDQGPDGEIENVRFASAISLGRIGGMDDPTVLRSAGGTPPYMMGAAVEWAIENHGKLEKPQP
ncbi:HEAT repeat domain-containing protein [Pirellulaceae bacterium SH449]